MSSVDYSFQIGRVLAKLEHDSVSARHGPGDVIEFDEQFLGDRLYHELVASRRAAGALAALGAEAFADLAAAAEGANYYQLMALIGAMGEAGPEVGTPATETLVRFLGYRDDNVKRAAVEALARCRDPAAIEPIRPLCEVRDELLRSRALYAMAVMSPGADDRLGYLERGLRDGSSRALGELLAGPEEDVPWDALYLLVESPDPGLREAVLRLVSERRPVPRDLARRLASDHHPPVRRMAIEQLARTDDRDLVDLMLRALQDPEKAVARIARKWLDPYAAELHDRLLGLLDTGASLTRQMALELLAPGMDRRLLERVGGLLAVRSTKDMRLAALKVLDRHASDDTARAHLHKALADPVRDVRIAALEALARDASDADLESLGERLSRRGGTGARLVQTVELVREVATPAAREILGAHRSHASPYVCRAVAEALEHLGAQAAARSAHSPTERIGRTPSAGRGKDDDRRPAVLASLQDRSMTPAQKLASWAADMDTVLALVEDFSNDQGMRICEVLLLAGWEPRTPNQRAAAILSADAPDWQAFPEEAVPAMAPFFIERFDRRAFEVAPALLGRWPQACKPLIASGLETERGDRHARLVRLAIDRDLFSAEELQGWLDPARPGLHTAAARLLGRVGDARLLPRFLGMLEGALAERDEDLACALLHSLGDLGERRALPAMSPLLDATGDPPASCTVAAVRGIAAIEGDEANRLLLYALRRSRLIAQASAARALERRGWAPEAEPDRARFALHLRRYDELRTLGEGALPVVVEHATREHADPVPFEVMEYLFEHDTHEAIDAVARARWGYLSAEHRKIERAYRKRTRERAVPVLVPALEDVLEEMAEYDLGPDARANRIVEWLASLKDPASIEILMRVLTRGGAPDGLERPAAEALARLGYAPAVPHIVTLLANFDDPAPKRVLAEALMRLGDASALPALREERAHTEHAPLAKALDKAIRRLEEIE